MNRRVVVADDEADIRRLINFTLHRRGYEVLEAATGDQALAIIRAARPALAVLDVMMPGLTGLEVTTAVRADPATSDIPVMLLSAKGQSTEVEAGLACGAALYLVKPFSPRNLAANVESLLGQRPSEVTLE